MLIRRASSSYRPRGAASGSDDIASRQLWPPAGAGPPEPPGQPSYPPPIDVTSIRHAASTTPSRQLDERDGRMRAEENKAVACIRTRDAALDWSMKGKTVLFTGASRGMGRFAAIELARLGAEVLVVGHNQARGAAAVEAIRGTGGSAQFLRADMGEAADVCALATAVLARSAPVEVLIHSAGGLLPADARTREGVDRGFAQNFLGAFLLTRLLEERLLASAPARVIAVGSAAHRLLKQVDLDAFMRPGTSPMNRHQMGDYQMRSYQTA